MTVGNNFFRRCGIAHEPYIGATETDPPGAEIHQAGLFSVR